MGIQLPINYDDADVLTRRAARQEYTRQQKGLCYYCKQPLSGPPSSKVNAAKISWRLFPPNFTKWPVHLHHSRVSGMTIGAVHARCNAYLWQFKGE